MAGPGAQGVVGTLMPRRRYSVVTLSATEQPSMAKDSDPTWRACEYTRQFSSSVVGESTGGDGTVLDMDPVNPRTPM